MQFTDQSMTDHVFGRAFRLKSLQPFERMTLSRSPRAHQKEMMAAQSACTYDSLEGGPNGEKTDGLIA